MTINGEDVSMGIPMTNLTAQVVNEWAAGHLGTNMLRNDEIGACWLSTGSVFFVDIKAEHGNPAMPVVSSAWPLNNYTRIHSNGNGGYADAFRWQPEAGSALSTLDVFNPRRLRMCGRAEQIDDSSARSIHGSNADGDPDLAALIDGDQPIIGAVLDLSGDGAATLLEVAASSATNQSYAAVSMPPVVGSDTPRIALSACSLTSTPSEVASSNMVGDGVGAATTNPCVSAQISLGKWASDELDDLAPQKVLRPSHTPEWSSCYGATDAGTAPGAAINISALRDCFHMSPARIKAKCASALSEICGELDERCSPFFCEEPRTRSSNIFESLSVAYANAGLVAMVLFPCFAGLLARMNGHRMVTAKGEEDATTAATQDLQSSTRPKSRSDGHRQTQGDNLGSLIETRLAALEEARLAAKRATEEAEGATERTRLVLKELQRHQEQQRQQQKESQQSTRQDASLTALFTRFTSPLPAAIPEDDEWRGAIAVEDGSQRSSNSKAPDAAAGEEASRRTFYLPLVRQSPDAPPMHKASVRI